MNHCRLVDVGAGSLSQKSHSIFFFLVERFGSTAAGIPIEYGAPPVRSPWYLFKLEALYLWLGELNYKFVNFQLRF
jgi:hypothetical protein